MSVANKVSKYALSVFAFLRACCKLLQYALSPDISEITETTINNLPVSTYNFEYLENTTNQNYYIQIYFIKINNKIYSIDVEFPISEKEILLPIISNILSTININLKNKE